MAPDLRQKMRTPSKLFLVLKSITQLGLSAVLLYLWYQFKLRSGILRWQTPLRVPDPSRDDLTLGLLFLPPDKSLLKKTLGKESRALFEEADEIMEKRVRLFGTEPRPLQLDPGEHRQHWTRYTTQFPDGADIKITWELGRFGWATVLARAYHLSGEERYASAFWEYTESFFTANPPNLGPHWSSAQEVALRLIALSFCFSLLADSKESTAERKGLLAANLAAHAERIPPSLAYARAQNNNHLLSEALGLYTAAALMPTHPKAAQWHRLGRVHIINGLNAQIDPHGNYIQHSSNYHRLMLQLALWAGIVAANLGDDWPPRTRASLAAATRWLLTLLDDDSGKVPNLGPNDGAYILPLSVLPFGDFRPVLHAAGRAFLGTAPLPAGPWDEMSLWLTPDSAKALPTLEPGEHPLRLEGVCSWAYLRAAHFRARPGHADQLHLDLWWRGLNLAQDAGSYLYTAPEPLDNALAATRVHNTLIVDGHDQMLHAGRFLWLDWAQAALLDIERDKRGKPVSARAEHDGYRHLGLRHRREVRVDSNDRWTITDTLLPDKKGGKPVQARLHWLLPDWEWQLSANQLQIASPHGQVELSIRAEPAEAHISLIRAGEVLAGSSSPDPVMGWFSPTYGAKNPALSLVADLNAPAPIRFTSIWSMPH